MELIGEIGMYLHWSLWSATWGSAEKHYPAFCFPKLYQGLIAECLTRLRK